MAQKKKKPAGDETESVIRGILKNPIKSLGIVIVVVMIVFAFVLPGTELTCASGEDLAFGYYDKEPINYLPVAQRFRDIEEFYRQNNMDSSRMGYQEWLWSFDFVVTNTAMLHELKRAGYTVPDIIVDRAVARMFLENGRFSVSQYNNLDESTRRNIWERAKENIALEKYRSDVFGLTIPDGETEFIASMAANRRSFNMAVFPIDQYPDSEIITYAEENPELFRSAHLLIISAEASEQEARDILERIQSGEYSPEDAARMFSKDEYSERGGDMGIKMAHELRYEIPSKLDRDQIVSLEKDDFSEIINTVFGWSIFYALEDAEEPDLGDQETLDKIRSYIREVEGGRIENWAIDRANDFISQANEIGFENALTRNNVESRSFGPIPLNYGNIDLFDSLASQSVDELFQADDNENFWRAAFSTQINSPSQPVVHRGNVLVLFPVPETNIEDFDIEDPDTEETFAYNSDWLRNNNERSLSQFFMTSPKMEDRFQDIYFQYLMPRDN